MKKRLTLMIIFLAVVFGGLVLFNLFRTMMIERYFANFEPPAVSVSSAVAQKVDWQSSIATVGNFLAINGVDISSQASGNVMEIHFDSGQYVFKGEPLITLDDSVDVAVLKFNQAQLVLKQLNYKRQLDLLKKGATPSSSVDEARANLQQAQAKVEEVQAQIRQKHITAPFDGKVGIRQVNLGEYVTPGKTSVVTLQSLDPLYLEFYLPEQLYKQIKVNQTISFTVEGFPDILFEGSISALNSKIDLNTHNVQVQAILPNCPLEALKDPLHSPLVKTRKEDRGSRLIVTCNSPLNQKNKTRSWTFIPGMFASVKILQALLPNTVIVPATAISYSLYGNSIYTIEKHKAEKPKTSDFYTVKRVFVSTGEQVGNYTVIKKGIKAGQLVVATGDMKLENGTHVLINNDIGLHEKPDLEHLGQ